MLYYIKKFSRCLILLQLSPFDWKCLQIGTQRAKDLRKKCIYFSRGRIHSCPTGTARNQGSFTPYVLWSVKSLNSPTVISLISQEIMLNTQMPHCPNVQFYFDVTSLNSIKNRPFENYEKNLIKLHAMHEKLGS